MKNELDKLFKNRLSNLKEAPGAQAWEQVRGQLASNRRKLWGKRLAIAASFLLLATLGFFGYRSLSTITIKKDQLAIGSVEERKENQQPLLTSEVVVENENPKEIIPIEKENETSDRATVFAEVKSVEKKAGLKPDAILQGEKNEGHMPVVAEGQGENTKLPDETGIEGQEQKTEDYSPSGLPAEIILAENKANGKQEIAEQTKSYPQIKIIYKVEKNSSLITSEKKSLMTKGLKELTKFSDEHLLTAERKTRLRNTKEDLLALNFGKLLNKPNTKTKN